MSTEQKKIPVILVTGKNGQVGWELQRSLMPLGRVIAVDRQTMDLSSNDSIVKVIREVKPDIIVNAAAYTAVDKAEEEKELAMQINGIAPGIMAEEARVLGALLVHYSTDYVFDGTKTTPYVETDIPNPINEYGRSKLAGEQAIQNTDCDHLIFRTSWVYGARGKNFLLTMLKLMQEREELSVINDQHGTPTWSRLIAEVTASALGLAWEERKQHSFTSDLFHLTASSETTWHGFASEIANLAKQETLRQDIKNKNIISIQTSQYPTPASRPKNSRISTSSLTDRFGLAMPEWDVCLKLCISDLS